MDICRLLYLYAWEDRTDNWRSPQYRIFTENLPLLLGPLGQIPICLTTNKQKERYPTHKKIKTTDEKTENHIINAQFHAASLSKQNKKKTKKKKMGTTNATAYGHPAALTLALSISLPFSRSCSLSLLSKTNYRRRQCRHKRSFRIVIGDECQASNNVVFNERPAFCFAFFFSADCVLADRS